jgi:hypothetical protein
VYIKRVRGVTSTGRLTESWEWNRTIMFHIRQSAVPKLHFCKSVCSIYVVSHILRLLVLKWVFVRKFASTVNGEGPPTNQSWQFQGVFPSEQQLCVPESVWNPLTGYNAEIEVGWRLDTRICAGRQTGWRQSSVSCAPVWVSNWQETAYTLLHTKVT